jgi:hypothetical protein
MVTGHGSTTFGAGRLASYPLRMELKSGNFGV